jgi:hypothetical protein
MNPARPKGTKNETSGLGLCLAHQRKDAARIGEYSNSIYRADIRWSWLGNY